MVGACCGRSLWSREEPLRLLHFTGCRPREGSGAAGAPAPHQRQPVGKRPRSAGVPVALRLGAPHHVPLSAGAAPSSVPTLNEGEVRTRPSPRWSTRLASYKSVLPPPRRAGTATSWTRTRRSRGSRPPSPTTPVWVTDVVPIHQSRGRRWGSSSSAASLGPTTTGEPAAGTLLLNLLWKCPSTVSL